MKFDPPLKPFISDESVQINPIKCPNCDSEDVFVCTLVTATGLVNINTFEVNEILDDGEVMDQHEVRNLPRYCLECRHEWTMEGDHK